MEWYRARSAVRQLIDGTGRDRAVRPAS